MSAQHRPSERGSRRSGAPWRVFGALTLVFCATICALNVAALVDDLARMPGDPLPASLLGTINALVAAVHAYCVAVVWRALRS